MEFQIHKDVKFTKNSNHLKTLEDIQIDKYFYYKNPRKYLSLNNQESVYKNYNLDEGILLERKDKYILDFGEHTVGKVSLDITTEGSPPDAPAKIKLIFGETLDELSIDEREYTGKLSASWLQEELLTIDTLPSKLTIDRRLAFRYIKINVIDTSPKYKINIKVNVRNESSADVNEIEIIDTNDNLLKEIDYVSQITLAHCMQDVFEDGPKRDRRLWLGDLRLQALANYFTYNENNLVKKCLYLFAAETRDDGLVSANVFIEPHLIPDDTFLADYSLFFIDVLLEYYLQTGDKKTLDELYQTAVNQYLVLDKYIDEKGQVKLPDGWSAFIEWNNELDKTVAIHGVYIYSYKKLVKLAELLSDYNLIETLNIKIKKIESWVMNNYYSKEIGLFINPLSKQVSDHSQTWMALADIESIEFRENLLKNMLEYPKDKKISCVTPYMYHHYVEALLIAGMREQALGIIKNYWGGMIEEGADTFWEIYNQEDPNYSPYGDTRIHSYCHAWSCTPCYLFRKY